MVFSRAQASSPCVIFFDELDALCPSRSNEAESQSSSRLVNTLLTEMDGMTGRKQVFVIAATNRPDMIDPAMLRPGRLDKALYVDLPNEPERREILKTLTRKTPLADDVDLGVVAAHPSCAGMSGADLSSLVREAAVTSLRAAYYSDKAAPTEKLLVSHDNFVTAFSKVGASVNKKDRRRYELLKVKFGSAAAEQKEE
jgi:ribosome biogenesis ATPase